MSDIPLIQPLPASTSAVDVFHRLADKPHCLFLDSSLRHGQLGRYSFLTADPFDVVRINADGSDALAVLHERMAPFATKKSGCVEVSSELPPFLGGAAGLLGYELSRSIENVPHPKWDEFGLPALAVGLYDVVIAFDHVTNRAWLISQGLPETSPVQRAERARLRSNQFLQWLDDSPVDRHCIELSRLEIASPVIPTKYAGIFSNFSESDYQAAVATAIEYIRAGDIFQVNLAQRLMVPATESAVELYDRLRQRSPATFGAYFDGGDFQIVSTSPERFVQVKNNRVETRPIKGTRRRMERAEADLFSADVLRNDDKERAENVMIVDLLRNDLSRVCQPDSVLVTQLCGLEEYGYVQHLVSAVEGTLNNGQNSLDLIRAAFPGGSITGAPKVRAMEVITELEQTARGAYCGALGYIGWDGAMDLSILIRTITVAGGWLLMPVGGGVTVRSDPKREYDETWHKAAGMLKAVERNA